AALAAVSPAMPTAWAVTRRLLRHSALKKRVSMVSRLDPPGWLALGGAEYAATETSFSARVGDPINTLFRVNTPTRPLPAASTMYMGPPDTLSCMTAGVTVEWLLPPGTSRV